MVNGDRRLEIILLPPEQCRKQSLAHVVRRFCGWVDVGLSSLGEKEAARAGEAIKEAAIDLDMAYTSHLK